MQLSSLRGNISNLILKLQSYNYALKLFTINVLGSRKIFLPNDISYRILSNSSNKNLKIFMEEFQIVSF